MVFTGGNSLKKSNTAIADHARRGCQITADRAAHFFVTPGAWGQRGHGVRVAANNTAERRTAIQGASAPTRPAPSSIKEFVMNMPNEETFAMRDFEQAAENLIHMMFVLTEQRINSQQDREPVGRALAETALTINAALHSFILIEKLHGE
jgi:hypothetical protein